MSKVQKIGLNLSFINIYVSLKQLLKIIQSSISLICVMIAGFYSSLCKFVLKFK